MEGGQSSVIEWGYLHGLDFQTMTWAGGVGFCRFYHFYEICGKGQRVNFQSQQTVHQISIFSARQEMGC